MLKSIKAQISYRLTPAEDILNALASSNENDLFFLKDCKNYFQQGNSFSDSWKSSVKENSYKTCLNKNDLELLKSFSDIFGTSDKSGQTENCDLFISEFETLQRSAHEKAQSAPKIYNSLGLLTGILSVILFI